MLHLRLFSVFFAAVFTLVNSASAEAPAARKISPGDTLCISVGKIFPDCPIDGAFVVNQKGQLEFGEPYSDVSVAGMTLPQAVAAIKKSLEEAFVEPHVACIEFCQSAPTPCQQAFALQQKKEAEEWEKIVKALENEILKAEEQVRAADMLAQRDGGSIKVLRPERKEPFQNDADFFAYLASRKESKKLLVVVCTKIGGFDGPKQRDAFEAACKKAGVAEISWRHHTGVLTIATVRGAQPGGAVETLELRRDVNPDLKRAFEQRDRADVLASYDVGTIELERPARKQPFQTEADFLKYLADRKESKQLLVVILSKRHKFSDPKQTVDGFCAACKKAGVERVVIHRAMGKEASPIVRE